MKTNRKPYVTPVVTKVTFDDKKLVEFNVCKKQASIERDSASCCTILPFNDYNKTNFDPS